ncbi:MAG: UV-stimulated scaffold A protein [Trebouxia sp. A1-2]|nr:MAG: UV-stimulated scaffold A protein [Trebouxia sp. A1-2]
MALQLDANALGALTKLLDKVTDKHESHQDTAALQQIKSFCKQSDENITWFSSVLLHRLKEDHAQTRLHVVNISDQLFQRSKAFRTHVTAHFTEFLELSLGFRHDKPLPGPANIANQLRDRALEIVEQWNDKFGSSYKQVALGFNYLKHNMAMRFPEVRARAAAADAEACERQARSQALLQEKYHHIRTGFHGHMSDMKTTLTQIAEGFSIIEGTSKQRSEAPSGLQAPGDEIAWETVEAAEPAAEASTLAAPAEVNVAEEGLSAYAMDTIPEDLLQQAETSASMGSEGVNRAWVSLRNLDPAVVETLLELDKVLVDMGEVGSHPHAELEHLLRSSIDLQTQLRQSHQKLEGLSQQLSTLSASEQGTAADSAPLRPGDAPSVSGQPKPIPGTPGAALKQTGALLKGLFGSDEDDSDSADHEADSQKAAPAQQAAASSMTAAQTDRLQQVVSRNGQPASQQSGKASAALHSSTDRQPAAARSSSGPSHKRGLPGDSIPSSSSLGQSLVDPTAPKRSISFSDSMRRRQSSSVIQRREAFNEAADAAISQALSQRAATAAPTKASELASESAQGAAMVKPEADVSSHVMAVSVPQQASHVGHVTAAAQLDQANHVTASDQSQRSSSTQTLPCGRTGSGLRSENPAEIKQDNHEEEQDAPKLITRTSQAEAAPKLKTGSRLAASMAKLAAAKKAGSAQADVAAPAAVAAPLPPKDDGKKSVIPEDIKRALLAKAPVVAHGNDLVYWDTNNARALVNARGMEYQNHWGAHDPDVELPSQQLNAFFGTRAEYWTPSAKSQAPQGQPQQPPGHPSGHSKHSAGQLHNQAGPAKAAPRQAGKETAVPSAASRSENTMGTVRAQRAADRAHNEAVIASTDEQVAQALADEEAQAAVKSSSQKGRGTKRKPQPTVRERLAKKLLSGKARGQTLGEVESAADERFQEVNSNRWQATRFP